MDGGAYSLGNAYVQDLLKYDWELEESPAGLPQWFPVLKDDATETKDDIPDIRMLTADIALLMVLDLLESIKTDYPDISHVDLIIMAGNIALEQGGDLSLDFCKGRVDATEGDGQISILEPREYDDVIAGVRDRMKIMGLSVPQFVVLAGRPRSLSQMARLGYCGSYTEGPTTVSNAIYKIILTETWEEVEGSVSPKYQLVGNPGVYALSIDLALVWDPKFKAKVVLYVENNELFLHEFASAWTTLMNADRFDGPFDNLCD